MPRLVHDLPDDSLPDDKHAVQRDVFPRIWSGMLLFLLAGTWPLWLAARGDYPSIPLFPSLWSVGPVGIVLPWLALILLLASLVTVFSGKAGRWSHGIWWLVTFCLGTLMLADQHRLQPWAYQSLLYAALFASMPPHSRRPWLMAITISIYFYSSIGKLDYQFLHTVGKEFLETALALVGGVPEPLRSHTTKLVALMPLMECAIAVLLCIPATRLVGGCAAIAMHMTLFGLLGPWAMDHSWGVLLWNVLLAIQAWWLFVRQTESNQSGAGLSEKSSPSGAGTATHRVQMICKAFVVVTLLLPLTERYGIWDHWTSWALYSPHSSRVDVQVQRSVVDTLPSSLQAVAITDENDTGWQSLALERWSLDERYVPIYPQGRYQLALAVKIAEEYSLGRAIRARIRSVSDRWDGTREETFVLGAKEISRAQDNYWLLP